MKLLHACAYVCANVHIYMNRVMQIAVATRWLRQRKQEQFYAQEALNMWEMGSSDLLGIYMLLLPLHTCWVNHVHLGLFLYTIVKILPYSHVFKLYSVLTNLHGRHPDMLSYATIPYNILTTGILLCSTTDHSHILILYRLSHNFGVLLNIRIFYSERVCVSTHICAYIDIQCVFLILYLSPNTA